VIDWRQVLLASAMLIGLALVLHGCAAPAEAREPRVPQASWQYRVHVERATTEYFGLHGSPARLAAQLHQESLWKPDAQSAYADGLAQFVPATARWLPEVCPELGKFDPWDPLQSIRAAACYNRWHYDRVRKRAATECDGWAYTLSAYNGGLGWLLRDVRRASSAGDDPARWFGHVEGHSARAGWAIRENREYVRRVLLDLEPAYLKAGWDGAAVCP
jgi:hypothetical protein